MPYLQSNNKIRANRNRKATNDKLTRTDKFEFYISSSLTNAPPRISPTDVVGVARHRQCVRTSFGVPWGKIYFSVQVVICYSVVRIIRNLSLICRTIPVHNSFAFTSNRSIFVAFRLAFAWLGRLIPKLIYIGCWLLFNSKTVIALISRVGAENPYWIISLVFGFAFAFLVCAARLNGFFLLILSTSVVVQSVESCELFSRPHFNCLSQFYCCCNYYYDCHNIFYARFKRKKNHISRALVKRASWKHIDCLTQSWSEYKKPCRISHDSRFPFSFVCVYVNANVFISLRGISITFHTK